MKTLILIFALMGNVYAEKSISEQWDELLAKQQAQLQQMQLDRMEELQKKMLEEQQKANERNE